MIIHSEQEMLEFGSEFANNFTWAGDAFLARTPSQAPAKMREDALSGPAQSSVIELIGDVGAGKTTFVRGFAKSLGIKEPITSPSFTISKSYPLKSGGNLIHYDFYRLSDPGIMLDDLADNLTNPQNIIVVEWGENAQDILPANRHIINIKYQEDGAREVTL